MFGKLRSALLAAMFLGLGSGVAMAADIDAAAAPGSGQLSGASNIHTSTGNVDAGWATTAVDLNGNALSIGKAAAATAANRTLTLGISGLSNSAAASTLTITQSDGVNGLNRGTQLTVAGTLDLTNITKVTLDDSDPAKAGINWQNRLIVDTLATNTAGDSTITVGGDSLFQVNNTATFGDATNSLKLVLGSSLDSSRGGNATFTNGVTIANGSITGTGTVKGAVTLNGTGGDATKASITAAAGQTLNLDAVTNTMGTIAAASGATGDAVINAASITQDGGSLALTATGNHDALMNVTGNMTVAGGTTTLTGGTSSEARLTVGGDLTISQSVASTGFAINGAADGSGKAQVSANRLVMDNTGAKAQLNINAHGALVTGKTAAAPLTDEIRNGDIVIAANGSAEFNNNVAMANASAITATGATGTETSVTFANNVSLADTSSITVASGAKATFGTGLSMTGNGRVIMDNGGTVDISTVAPTLNGRFRATGATENFLIVGNGKTAVGHETLYVDANSKLTVQQAEFGNLGDLAVNGAQTITLGNGSTLNVGALSLLGNASGFLFTPGLTTGQNATVNANSFAVANGARVTGDAYVTTNIDGSAVIQGAYTAAGTKTTILGSLLVNNGGALNTVAAGAGINLGANGVDVRSVNVIVNNGSLAGTALNALQLTNINTTHRSQLIFNGVNNTVSGLVTASGGAGFDIFVHGDLNLKNTGTILSGSSYTQTSGRVANINGAGNQRINVTEQANISGPGSVFATSATFAGGVNISGGATLAGTRFGSNRNNITGAVGSNFNLDAASVLDLNLGDITITGFDNVAILGTIRLGAVGNRVSAAYTSGNGKTFGDIRKIELGESFAAGYTGTADNVKHYIFRDSGAPVGTPVEVAHSISNIYGDYGFRYREGDGAWLSSYATRDVADVAGVRASLTSMWDNRIISTGLAANVSAVAVNVKTNGVTGARISPANSLSGNLNFEILKAFGLGGNGSGYRFGDISGTLDRGLVAAYNGSSATGVVFTSQDVTRELMTTLHARVADVRIIRNEIESVTSTTALASLSVADALNNQYLNRIWAGGLGMWQNTDRRGSFDGYKYDAAGVMLGYDRAFGAVVGGLAAAYMEGDYKDKTAASHDSKIKNYAIDAYMTYSACNGFFTTIMGGYNYSDNNIRELRGRNWARQDYHTNTWHASGRLGYDFAPTESLTISPAVGVDFFYSESSAHDLSLANARLLRYGKMKNNNVELPVEVKMAYHITMGDQKDLTLMANGGYAYNLNDHGVNGYVGVTDVAGLSPMRAVGRNLGHHSWKAGAGAKYRQGQWDVGVKYDYYGRSHVDNHRIMGTVGYSF